MPSLFEYLAKEIAGTHATWVYRRFRRALERPVYEQQQALRRALHVTRGSAFAHEHALHRVRNLADLRRALPIRNYEQYRPYIERVCAGEHTALFARREPILMFATSSGTTALPKRIPVTRSFVKDYRRGWNTFGLKVLDDHHDAILRAILPSTGRYDEEHTATGIPIGAITGLLAKMQKRFVRRLYVGRPEVAYLRGAQQRYYALMRLAVVRDVAWAITASPGTLIEMARVANEHRAALIRDVHDGTLAEWVDAGSELRATLLAGVRPQPERARELERWCVAHGVLRPRDYWRLSFLACWTGGSMGHYLERLGEWWGGVPVRDIGLLASEGRVSIPLADGESSGVLDVTAAAFEFIPCEEADTEEPRTLAAHELEVGQDYIVVLTNTTGLARYRLDDVVKVRGWDGRTPRVEFMYRAGRVASVAGEKLTENQVVAAVRAACAALGLASFDFVLAPAWADPPYYELYAARSPVAGLTDAVDTALRQQNGEYDSRRGSRRLGPVIAHHIPCDAIAAMDRRLAAARRGTAEQYKRPCLLTEPGQVEALLCLSPSELGGETGGP